MKRSRMALRLVLDTNVWLDWLVFDDPSILPLKAAVDAGGAEIFMASACKEELTRVLAFPLRRATLDAGVQAECLEECRRIVRWLNASTRIDAARLPVCRDPDDQKFLELANDCSADFLVTRDRALLVLERRKIQPLSFHIVTPEKFDQVIGSACHSSNPS
jgi:putative PIN family toxin of toxin-antitoxin system